MNTVLFLLPILLPAAGAAGAWALRGAPKRCGACARAVTILTFLAVLFCGLTALRTGAMLTLPRVLGLGLNFECTALQLMFALLAAFLWMNTTLFAREYLAHAHNNPRYYVFLLLTQCGILGVFFSADLYTTLCFFEVMSLASWVLVVQEEEPAALRAGDSYLAFAVLGGLVTLMGLFLLHHTLGTLRFSELYAAAAPYAGTPLLYTAGVLTLFGFAAKCAMFPLHTWLPTAHPVAPAPASALLSGIITKAGLFGLFVLSGRIFWGDGSWGLFILLFGTVTMVCGAVLGVFSINLKRTLACSSMSQIGFILVGVGMLCLMPEEPALPAWGLILHSLNHSLFKLCLFLCAGVVVMNLHKLDLNEIRGFGRGKPLLLFSFGMGALGIMGIPLWNGYVSKTLLHESIVEYAELLAEEGLPHGLFTAVEWLFLFSGGLTVCYMTKLFVCLFVEKNSDAAVQAGFDRLNGHYADKLSSFVLLVCGVLPPFLGLTAHFSMEGIARAAGAFFGTEGPEHTLHYLSLTNLKGAVISVAVGAAVYLLFVRGCTLRQGRYADLWPAPLNLEERLYRPLLLGLLPGLGAGVCRAADGLCRVVGLQIIPFVCTFAARLAGSLFEWFATFCRWVLHFGATKRLIPPVDDRFGIYDPAPQGTQGFTHSLAFGMMLFGCAFIGVLVWLLHP